ncbi:MAG: DUF2809 domain-containing protein [Galactobacter sp.]
MIYSLLNAAGTVAYAALVTVVAGMLLWWLTRRRVAPVHAWPLGLALCWGVELWQLTAVPARPSSAWIGFRLTLGTSFDWWDMAFYPAGVGVAVLALLLARRLTPVRRARLARPGDIDDKDAPTVFPWVPVIGHILISMAALPYLAGAARWLFDFGWLFFGFVAVGACMHLVVLVLLMGSPRRAGAWGRAAVLVLLNAVVLLILSGLGFVLAVGVEYLRLFTFSPVFFVVELLVLGAVAFGARSLIQRRPAVSHAGRRGLAMSSLVLPLVAVIVWGMLAAPVPQRNVSGYGDPAPSDTPVLPTLGPTTTPRT